MPIIRPGGVDLKLTATTESPAMKAELRVGGALFQGIISTQLPEVQAGYALHADAQAVPAMWSVMQTMLPKIETEEEELIWQSTDFTSRTQEETI